MKIELQNFFRYYNPELKHHRDAVKLLLDDLNKKAPDLLEDDAEWVKLYRNASSVSSQDPDLILPVPFYPQTDNYRDPQRTCNSSCCAMCLEYFRPETLHGPKGDDAYIRKVFAVGDTTDHSVQTKVLESYGVKSSFKYNLTFADLDKELSQKRPVIIGILHRGSLAAPTGGHMVVVIGKNSKGNYICNDPYGSLYNGYAGSVYQGKNVVYEKHILEKRWTVDGPNSGWGRVFYAKVESPVTERGHLPPKGLELIKAFEGLNLHAYPDPLTGDKPITIGWGSTKDIDGSLFHMGDKITAEKADLLLIHQLSTQYLPKLEQSIPYWDEMTDNQKGALLSFAYNLGANFYGGPRFRTITESLKNKQWYKVADAMLLYINKGTPVENGLLRRRKAEAELWESGL